MILESGADVPWLPPLVRTAARRHRMYAAAPLPQIQVTQEMQHLKEQVGQIDQLLRSQHPQQTLNSLNAQRIQLMAKLQSIARQQQGAQMMQYPQGTPQQSIFPGHAVDASPFAEGAQAADGGYEGGATSGAGEAPRGAGSGA